MCGPLDLQGERMSNEQLQIMALMLARNAYVLGMQADNQGCEARQEYPKWDYSDFCREASELEALASRAINT